MKFMVVWKATAEAQLAELWMTATDRKAIREAASEIESNLRADPISFGESRDAQTRVAVVAPLVVHFEVHEDDRRVIVLTLHAIPPSWHDRSNP